MHSENGTCEYRSVIKFILKINTTNEDIMLVSDHEDHPAVLRNVKKVKIFHPQLFKMPCSTVF